MSVQNILKKPAFTKTVMGYTVSEVDKYIDHVTERYNSVCAESAELKRRVLRLQLMLDEANAKLSDAEGKLVAEKPLDRSELYKVFDMIDAEKKRNEAFFENLKASLNDISEEKSCDSEDFEWEEALNAFIEAASESDDLDNGDGFEEAPVPDPISDTAAEDHSEYGEADDGETATEAFAEAEADLDSESEDELEFIESPAEAENDTAPSEDESLEDESDIALSEFEDFMNSFDDEDEELSPENEAFLKELSGDTPYLDSEYEELVRRFAVFEASEDEAAEDFYPATDSDTEESVIMNSDADDRSYEEETEALLKLLQGTFNVEGEDVRDFDHDLGAEYASDGEEAEDFEDDGDHIPLSDDEEDEKTSESVKKEKTPAELAAELDFYTDGFHADGESYDPMTLARQATVRKPGYDDFFATEQKKKKR